jgi:uncharacterized protein DUF5335
MPPRTIEIPRHDWRRALDEFSAVHDGWRISLDILAAELGAQPEISDLPLLGITFEAAGTGTLTITAGRSLADSITHTIQAPSHIWIERTEDGADAAVGVTSSDGTQAIIQLKIAAPPETVDGIAQPHP